MKFYLFFLFILVFPLLGVNPANADTPVFSYENEIALDDGKTIKELQENVKNLTIEKSAFKTKWETFRQENWKINDFIIFPISEDQIKEIEWIMNNYYLIVEGLEIKIEDFARTLQNTDSLKEELISSKIELFKKLVPYIKKDKLNEYLIYIKWNIEIEKEEKNIKDEIFRKQSLIDLKITNIKEKIEENRKILEEKIEEAVTIKVEEKIKKILENEKFKALDIDSQRRVFEVTFEKIKEKKEILNNIESKTTIIDKKIEVYNIVEDKLIEVIESIK